MSCHTHIPDMVKRRVDNQNDLGLTKHDSLVRPGQQLHADPCLGKLRQHGHGDGLQIEDEAVRRHRRSHVACTSSVQLRQG